MRRGRARRTDLEARHRRPPRPADAFPARGPCTDIHRGGKMLGSAPLWRRRGWWRGRRAGESRRAGRWCHQHRTPRWGPRRTASPRLSDGRPASSTQPAFRSGANPPEGHLGLSGSSRPLICHVGMSNHLTGGPPATLVPTYPAKVMAKVSHLGFCCVKSQPRTGHTRVLGFCCISH
jgi:hypothetical protein